MITNKIMKNAIKFELYNNVHNRFFKAAFIFVIALTVIHILINIIPCASYIYMDGYPENVFCHLIGYDNSIVTIIYFYIIIGISAFPSSLIYVMEKRNGYFNNLLVREKRKTLFVSKYIACVITSGIIAMVPLVIDYMVSSALLPSLRPIASTFQNVIDGKYFAAGFFYSYPTLYVFLRIIIVGMFSSCFASLVFMTEKIFKMEYEVMLFPEVLFLLMHVICLFFQHGEYSPFNIVSPNDSYGVKAINIFILLIILVFVDVLGMELCIHDEEI